MALLILCCGSYAAMFFLLLFSSFLNQASLSSIIQPVSVPITFNNFNPDSCNNGNDLICMGSVTAGNGYLSLTPEPYSTLPPPLNKVRRVLSHQPVFAWPAMFTTTFTVRISKFPDATGSGDGMAFIMAQDNKPPPPNGYGFYLGIMDKSTQDGVVRQLAVELDTYMNEYIDPDGNHIGVDTTSMATPVAAKSLNSTGIDLKSGRNITVKIDYDGAKQMLRIYIAYAGQLLISVLNPSIIMSRIILAIVIPILVLMIVVVVTYLFIRRTLKRKRKKMKKEDIENRARSAANVPILFSYKQLQKATHNFSKENLLGKGGCGTVYKGTLQHPTTIVVVKKISAASHQGEREYLAEICTIGRLRHKNLVQLRGWCHAREHLLLVYEYMANGSLDLFIGRGFLDWKTRYKILTGLASALLYLHEECNKPVVHRDFKPNNVILDSEYNARLGDFGLARLIQNDACVTTMMAGTPGYLAPEVSFSGKATPESDGYSFGMVALEVACGRRSKGLFEENSLVDYVWSLYGKNALLECVDKQLEGEFDEEQVKRTLTVGLASLHPDRMLRPKIRKVVQIFLNPNEPLMDLPHARPNAVYVSVSSASTTDVGSSSVATADETRTPDDKA